LILASRSGFLILLIAYSLSEALAHDPARLIGGGEVLFHVVGDFADITPERQELAVDVAHSAAIGDGT